MNIDEYSVCKPKLIPNIQVCTYVCMYVHMYWNKHVPSPFLSSGWLCFFQQVFEMRRQTLVQVNFKGIAGVIDASFGLGLVLLQNFSTFGLLCLVKRPEDGFHEGDKLLGFLDGFLLTPKLSKAKYSAARLRRSAGHVL